MLAVERRRLNDPQRHLGGQMAERLGNRATNQKVAGSIPGRAKLRCVFGQGTSPYLPQRGGGGGCPCTFFKSLWIRVNVFTVQA